MYQYMLVNERSFTYMITSRERQKEFFLRGDSEMARKLNILELQLVEKLL